MIEAITEISHLGLLKRAVPSLPLILGGTTLVYGENGRGKSTLAALMRAFASRDARMVMDRANWHSGRSPLVKLKVNGADGTFANGAWHGATARMAVFDMRFVEENVHSGWNLQPEHRERLYTFVLGEEARTLDEAYRKADDVEKSASAVLRGLQERLQPYHKNLTTAKYLAIAEDAEIEEKIADAERRKQEATNAQLILKRPAPSLLKWKAPDLSHFWEVLALSYQSAADDAENRVRAHIKALPGKSAEGWVAAGLSHTHTDSCPFCDQPLVSSSLVPLYRQYFDQEYRRLRDEAAELAQYLSAQFTPATEQAIDAEVRANVERAAAWKGAVDIVLATFDATEFRDALQACRSELEELASAKAAAPMDALESSESKASVAAHLERATAAVWAYNQAVAIDREAVATYQERLMSVTPSEVEAELVRLRQVRERFSKPVSELVRQYRTALGEHKQKRLEKDAALQALNDHAAAVFREYHAEINTILSDFGTGYTIGNCADDHKGGVKRVEYVLDFKGVAVGFVGEEKYVPGKTFGDALSEGDRRTLALAFFLARVRKDPRLADTIVVLDDPICSLGASRREATIRLLTDLQTRCRQLIVFCHDGYFLKDLAKRAGERHHGGTRPVALTLDVAADGTSVLLECDLEGICASDYSRNYELVREYVEKGGAGNHATVRSALRPVAEGYLKRRWVGRFDNCDGLGAMLGIVRGTDPSGEYAALHNSLKTLNDLNDYSRPPHHASGENSTRSLLNPAEVLTHAKKLMGVVYGQA